jgi:hypothetical protein
MTRKYNVWRCKVILSVKMVFKWRDELCNQGFEMIFRISDGFTLKVLRTNEKRYWQKGESCNEILILLGRWRV